MAAARKSEAERDKLQLEQCQVLANTRKLNFESVRLVVVSVAFAYGFLALFCYCFFRAKFVPTGVTTGDTLLFVFLALALGSCGLALSALGGFLWVPAVYEAKTSPRPQESAKAVAAAPARRPRPWAWAAAAGCLRGIVKPRRVPGWLRALFRICYAASVLLPFVLACLAAAPPGDWLPQALLDRYTTEAISLTALAVAVVAGYAAMRAGAVSIAEAVLWTVALFVSFVSLGAVMAAPGGYVVVAASLIGGQGVAMMLAGLPHAAPAAGAAAQAGAVPAKPARPDAAAAPRRGPAEEGRLLFAGVALFAPIFILAAWSPPENSRIGVAPLVFGGLGFYAEDAAMQVSRENLQALLGAAALQNQMLSVCHGPDNTAIVTGLKVWWHGMGTRSHVELPPPGTGSSQQDARAGQDAQQQRGARVDLVSAGVQLIRNYNTRCLEVPDLAFFSSGEQKLLTRQGREELLTAVTAMVQSGSQGRVLQKIEVIGHADPMPWRSGSNEDLAQARADHVKEELGRMPALVGLLPGKERSIKSSTVGSRQPVRLCKVEGSLATQRECNAVNRRVELRMHFAAPPR